MMQKDAYELNYKNMRSFLAFLWDVNIYKD